MVKQRENHKWIEKRIDSEGFGLCLVPTCNNRRQLYKNGKTTRNYCKNHTCFDLREFNNWGYLRNKVFERDNYTCVKCGIQPKRRIGLGFHNEYKEKIEKEYKNKILGYEECNEKWNSGYTNVIIDEPEPSELIADHIIPIACNGDEWDINNIQTICKVCNKIKTAQDAKDIAKVRQIDKKFVDGQIKLFSD